MLYELIIETRQPHCGGKHPKVYEFLEVETSDPLAFVRVREPELAELLVLENLPNGDIVIRAEQDRHQVTYQFTEA